MRGTGAIEGQDKLNELLCSPSPFRSASSCISVECARTGLLNDLKGERVLQENFALSTHNFYKENPDIPTSDCTRRDHHTGPGTAIGTHKSFMPTHVGQRDCWVSTLVSLSALTPAGHVPFRAEDIHKLPGGLASLTYTSRKDTPARHEGLHQPHL